MSAEEPEAQARTASSEWLPLPARPEWPAGWEARAAAVKALYDAHQPEPCGGDYVTLSAADLRAMRRPE